MVSKWDFNVIPMLVAAQAQIKVFHNYLRFWS